ncbi:MAG: TrmH family RNA methyltransferase [Candidatus Nanopelagicales bacterium]
MTVGPHPQPWPDDPRLDPVLLEHGDTRNVEDRFRYWRREAIVADLDTTRHPVHVAIENFQHDFNIGSVVRTANAFNVAAVHIVGKRRWNRRGAMVTDRYQHVEHHAEPSGLLALSLPVIGIDNIDGSRPIERTTLPRECILVFGQEGPGLSPASIEICQQVLHITQYGSTRSINAGAAAAIAMYTWALQHA